MRRPPPAGPSPCFRPSARSARAARPDRSRCSGSVARRRSSWRAQPLPSGSLKYMNAAPSSGAYATGSETSGPRAVSSARAASMSATQSWRPWWEPGAGGRPPAVSRMLSPSAIEQPEPGGVSWTMRVPGMTSWSMSTWKPTLSRWKSRARSMSLTASGSTSRVVSMGTAPVPVRPAARRASASASRGRPPRPAGRLPLTEAGNGARRHRKHDTVARAAAGPARPGTRRTPSRGRAPKVPIGSSPGRPP